VPAPGDVIVLLGGRTGRDGIGGATGSSKATSSKASRLRRRGAEGQRPHGAQAPAPVPPQDACRLIKRCNDFGAGGVSVAIGELADGLYIDLNKVPKKYEGLDGTELAISESQERMAVALAPEDVDKFIAIATRKTSRPPRWPRSRPSRACHGVERQVHRGHQPRVPELQRRRKAPERARAARHRLAAPVGRPSFGEKMETLVSDLNVCSQKGLGERFDSTIGAATVLMPFGGKYQLTPRDGHGGQAARGRRDHHLLRHGVGLQPLCHERGPLPRRGAQPWWKASPSWWPPGFCYEDAYLTFQEYFERLTHRPRALGQAAGRPAGRAGRPDGPRHRRHRRQGQHVRQL
jgi:phosphoribosylformylglycinamidine synthase